MSLQRLLIVLNGHANDHKLCPHRQVSTDRSHRTSLDPQDPRRVWLAGLAMQGYRTGCTKLTYNGTVAEPCAFRYSICSEEDSVHEEKKEAKESDVTCGKPGQQAPPHRCRGIQVQPKCYLPQILPILLSTQGTLLEKMSKDSRKCFTHMTQVSRSSIAGLFLFYFCGPFSIQG